MMLHTSHAICRSRRDCGNLEAVSIDAGECHLTSAAVAATAAILRRNFSIDNNAQVSAAVAATAAILRRGFTVDK